MTVQKLDDMFEPVSSVEIDAVLSELGTDRVRMIRFNDCLSEAVEFYQGKNKLSPNVI